MTDSVTVFDPLFRLTDANGDPVSGGYLEFYRAGTTTPLTVYSDADLTTALGTTVYVDAGGAPVASQGSSTKVLIYTSTTDYKVIAYDANAVSLGSFDNLPGALDTTAFGGTSGQSYSVVSKAATSWSVDGTATGIVLYNANPSGGSQSADFPSAVTVGDGFLFGIRHDGLGSTNTVSYSTVGGETIRHNGSTAQPGGVLTHYGQVRWFISDGAGWNVIQEVAPTIVNGGLRVQERRTSPPASPVEGGFYIISSTPAGTWDTSGFAANDLLQYVSGTYMRHVPYANCGWTAYVVAEGVNYQYTASGWVGWSNIFAPATTYTKKAIFRYQVNSGAAGGNATSGSWQTYPIATFLNSAADNVITGAALASNKISGLPVGWYSIAGSAYFRNTNITQLRLYNVTTSTEVFVGTQVNAITDGSNYSSHDSVPLVGTFQVTNAAHEYRIEYRCSRTQNSDGLGAASSWGTEVYGTFEFTDLSALRGPQGPIGNDGPAGATGSTGAAAPAPIDLTWSTTTSGDPGSGKLLATNASLSSATQLNVSETDRLGNSIAALLAFFDDGTSTTKGVLTLIDLTTPANRVYFKITGTVTSLGGYVTIPVTYLSGVTSLTNGRNLAAFFVPSGDAGSMTGPVSSTDGQMSVFNGTSGGALKTFSGTGFLTATSGVPTTWTVNGQTDKTTPVQTADYGLIWSAADGAHRKTRLDRFGIGKRSYILRPSDFNVTTIPAAQATISGTTTLKTAATAGSTAPDTILSTSFVRSSSLLFNGTASTKLYAWAWWLPPKSWNGGTVDFTVLFDVTSATGTGAPSGTMIFGMAGAVLSQSTNYSTLALGTAVTVSVSPSSYNTPYQAAGSSVTFGSSGGIGYPAQVLIELFRDPGTDTSAQTATFRGLEIKYSVNTNIDD